MSVTVEKKEHNMAVLTVTASAQELTQALNDAWKKDRKRINIPGFRRGKAPRKMIEQMYGKGVFFEDAANLVLQRTYDKAVEESGETVVSRPKIDITQIEEGKPFIYTAEVALKPAVTLGQYKGVEVAKTEISVSDDEIQKEIDKEREHNARMVDVDDRPVQKDDHIKLDFDGSIDGVPFDGGKAENYELVVGSGSFIPGFEDQIVGKNIGEEFDVNVTFPEDYQAENLKGKAAVFKCKVNSIQVKELPALDDDFAQDVSEFDTLEEYKKDVAQKIRERKENEAKAKKQSEALAEAVKNAEMDIPEAMVEEQAARMLDEFSQRIGQQGLSIDQYMQFTGMDRKKMMDQMKPEALKRIQNSLVLEAVQKAEKIECSDERFDEEIEKLAKAYNMEKDKLTSLMGEESVKTMKDEIATQMAAEFIADNAVEVEKPAEEEKKDIPQEQPADV